MTSEPEAFYVTFGVQYGHRDDDEKHAFGMYHDGYAVIEAPNYEVARSIAIAVFGQEWAFIYMKEDFIDDGTDKKYHPLGEQLRIAWQVPPPPHSPRLHSDFNPYRCAVCGKPLALEKDENDDNKEKWIHA